MKLLSRISILIAFGIVILLTPVLSSCSKEADSASLTDEYIYPVTPGTEQWLELGSHDEMLKVCQIPTDVLNEISTRGLIETVLKYPLSSDYLAYSSTQQGFEKVVAQFNGLSELLNRPDAPQELLIKYQEMNPGAINKKWNNLQRSEFFFSFLNIERLLAQHMILARLNNDEINNLISEAITKVDIKKQHENFFGWLGIEYSAWLVGRSLEHLGYPPLVERISTRPSVRFFLVNGSSSDEELRDELLLLGRQYLAEQ